MADTLHVEGFPDALRRRLRRVAASREVLIKQAVILAVTNWCDENEFRDSPQPPWPLGHDDGSWTVENAARPDGE